MRLVFLCGGSPHPEGRGLSYQWITTRAKGYQKKGHEVFVLAPYAPDVPAHYVLEDVNFYRLQSDRASRFISELNPDRLLIHHFTPWTIKASEFFSGGKIFWVYGPEISSVFSYYEKPGGITRFFLSVLDSLQNRKMRRFFLSGSGFVCTSHYAASQLSRFLPQLEPVVLRDPIVIPESPALRDRGKLIKGLAVELLEHRFLIPSGIDLLIKTFSSCPDAALTLLGDGNAVSDLQKWIKKEKSPVYLDAQEVSERKLSEWFQSHQYFLVASRMERFVFRACTAMSYGLPVIAPRRWAFPEIIQNGKTGYVFDPENPDSMLHGVKSIAKDYEILGANSRKWVVENCSSEVIIDQELSLIHHG
jgi:glycosyltransferase involved in cell wall biosynthesis